VSFIRNDTEEDIGLSCPTTGILRSNIHRVVNPPGAQKESKRLSVVYFNRPEDPVILKVLEGSDMIDEQLRQHPEYAEQEQVTSREWTMRRSLGKRIGGTNLLGIVPSETSANYFQCQVTGAKRWALRVTDCQFTREQMV
jgi:hypothetical protein